MDSPLSSVQGMICCADTMGETRGVGSVVNNHCKLCHIVSDTLSSHRMPVTLLILSLSSQAACILSSSSSMQTAPCESPLRGHLTLVIPLKEHSKRRFLRSRGKAASDDADWIEHGRAVHEHAAAAQLSSVKHQVSGTTSCHVTAE